MEGRESQRGMDKDKKAGVRWVESIPAFPPPSPLFTAVQFVPSHINDPTQEFLDVGASDYILHATRAWITSCMEGLS